MKKSILIGMVISYFFLWGCTGNEGSSSTPKKQKKTYNFELAGNMQTNFIVDSIKDKGNVIGNVYCLKAAGFQRIWFVAAKVKEKFSGYIDVAVWAMGGEKEQPGMTFSVNKYAKELSGFPLGSDTKAQISMSDDGAMDIKYYVDEQVKE